MPRPAVVRLFRVTLPGLPFTARPTVSCRSYDPYSRSHAPYDRFSAPTNQSVQSILPPARMPAMPVLKMPCFARVIQIYIVRQVVRSQVVVVGRLSSGLPLRRGSSVQPSPLSLDRLVRPPYPTSNFVTHIYPSLNESFKYLLVNESFDNCS